MFSWIWIQSVLRRRVAAGYTVPPTVVEAGSRGNTWRGALGLTSLHHDSDYGRLTAYSDLILFFGAPG
jgi:hypothetical protein